MPNPKPRRLLSDPYEKVAATTLAALGTKGAREGSTVPRKASAALALGLAYGRKAQGNSKTRSKP